ncbi:MAG: hypothetical protein LUH48_05800 [Clostridiales bacterium]|nr:hypothetical protein [Clostridiales bacterium]
MIITKSLDLPGRGSCSGTIDEPELCPLCHHAIQPQELAIKAFKSNTDARFISALYLCKSCYQTFVALYSCKLEGNTKIYRTELQYVGPQKCIPETFDPMVESLSPMFVKIYNQALAAETASLDEIAGLGYRKALEFLVKDFCIQENPDDADVIKGFPLAKCIQTYINNPQIQTLATKTAWLGNDEAHYVRKHSDRDVQDMKRFIQATVYFVGMSLIAEDAESISPA